MGQLIGRRMRSPSPRGPDVTTSDCVFAAESEFPILYTHPGIDGVE